MGELNRGRRTPGRKNYFNRRSSTAAARLRPLRQLAVILLMASPGYGQEGVPRPLTVDDIFRLEGFRGGETAFSPDARRLAYVRVRPVAEARHHDLIYMEGMDRSDVWVTDLPDGEPVNITRGRESGWGYWAPIWSPDGERLAMRCCDGLSAWVCVWEVGNDEGVRRVSERAVDVRFAPLAWLTPRELIVQTLPDGEKARSLTVLRETPEAASREWPKVRKGTEHTASVVESGIPIHFSTEPRGALVRIDVFSGEESVIHKGDVRSAAPSSGGTWVAGVAASGLRERDPGILSTVRGGGQETWLPRIFDAQGMRTIAGLDGLRPGTSFPMSWSPYGERIALLATPAGAGDSVAATFVADPGARTLRRYRTGALVPSRVEWADESRLLVHARAETERSDWWLVAEAENPRNLTGDLPSQPSALWRAGDHDSWIVLSGGDAWRISADPETSPENVTEWLDARISDIESMSDEATHLLVRAGGAGAGAAESLYQIDLRASRATPVASPGGASASLVASSPQGWLLFHEDNREGMALWLSGPGDESGRRLSETNTFLREIADADRKVIEYTSLDGQPLNGLLYLPIGYQEGRRYPLVTFVYAGAMWSQSPRSFLAEINVPHPLNLQLLTAKGFAVLLPSMPLPPSGQASDPYLELTKGVLPAVDKVLEIGVGDPNRLAVMGHSYGGYSAYGLITQTTRFRTAIAMAGLSDLVSLYGEMAPRSRYGAAPHGDTFQMDLAELGQIRMGAPPWEDLARYVRNSPISYVHRVETPVLIVQGDLDYVSITQGEQFFMSLMRQDKRARFIRYWGEEHVLSSPANIRHMWEEVFRWLAETMGGVAEAARAEASQAPKSG